MQHLSADDRSPPPRAAWMAAAVTVAFGLLIIVLLFTNVPWLLGPDFWRWAWRRLPSWPLYGLMAVSLVPLIVGHALWRPARARRTVVALVLAMISCYAMKLTAAAVHTRPLSLQVVWETVQSRFATSYYTDAAALNSQFTVREWLTQFPQLMSGLSLHSQTKAPGPILYYTLFVKLMGVSERTALVSGLVVGALGTLSIPAAYLLLRLLARDRCAAMCGATFLAICPGFVLFFPMFDPAYIMLSCALIGSWVLALEQKQPLAAIALGVTIALTCLISFHVLTIGLFMAALPMVVLDGTVKSRAVVSMKFGAIALVTSAILLMILRLATGYDAPATFLAAWTNQRALLQTHGHTRLYPQTIPFDLIDFALGSGWISLPIVIWFFLNRTARTSREMLLAILCLGQLVAVAVSGQLQLETARVWNFMLPLLMFPIGMELRTWPLPARVAVYATLCLITAVVAQNVKFIY